MARARYGRDEVRHLWIQVACPTCRAEPGHPCRRLGGYTPGRTIGRAMNKSHIARADAAAVRFLGETTFDRGIRDSTRVWRCWICDKMNRSVLGVRVAGCAHEENPG